MVFDLLDNVYETDEKKENERLYLTVFEPNFLDKSRNFYLEEYKRILRDLGGSSWLRYAQRRLEEELERCNTIISLWTQGKGHVTPGIGQPHLQLP